MVQLKSKEPEIKQHFGGSLDFKDQYFTHSNILIKMIAFFVKPPLFHHSSVLNYSNTFKRNDSNNNRTACDDIFP